MRRKGLLIGMLLIGIFCLTSISAVAAPPFLDGLWFKVKVSVKGYRVSTMFTDVLEKQTYTIPAYMEFVWTTDHYFVHIWTRKTDGNWAERTAANADTSDYSQRVIPNWSPQFYLDESDDNISSMNQTTFIKYVFDKNTGGVKKATLSGSGNVSGGFIGGGGWTYCGDAEVKGTTVDVSKLPFTP